MQDDRTPGRGRRSYGTGSLLVITDSANRASWYGKWRVGGRQIKRRIGPKRMEGTKDGLTRRQAEAELRRLMSIVTVAAVAGERLTITDLGRRYVHHLQRQGRKPATVRGVQSCLTVHLIPYFGDRGVDAIRVEDVDGLIAALEVRGVGPKSIRNYIGTLSAMLNFAKAPRRRWVRENVCDGVELPAVAERSEIRFLDVTEVEALVEAVPGGTYAAIDRALYVTGAMTGLRQGELIALRWMDVDWSASRIRVRQNYVLGQFGTPKSRRSTRSVPMADRVGADLERLYQATRDRTGRNPGDADLVFADPITEQPLSKAAILRRYRRALRAARLDPSRVFHDLRHTFGTRMAAAGVPMRTLQEWMGHRDIGTTLIYADYAPSAQEAAFVDAAFGSRRGSSPSGVLAP